MLEMRWLGLGLGLGVDARDALREEGVQAVSSKQQ